MNWLYAFLIFILCCPKKLNILTYLLSSINLLEVSSSTKVIRYKTGELKAKMFGGVIVVKYVYQFFDIAHFKRWSLISLPLECELDFVTCFWWIEYRRTNSVWLPRLSNKRHHSSRKTQRPYQKASCQQSCEWTILEAEFSASVKPPLDCSPSQQLDCNLMRDPLGQK